MAEENSTSEKQGTKPPPQPAQPRPGISWNYLMLLGLVVFIWLNNSNTASEQTTWLAVEKDMLSRRAIEKIEVINNERANIYLKESYADSAGFKEILKPEGKAINPGPHYTLTIGSVESFERKLDEAQKDVPLAERVEVTYVKKSNWLLSILSWIFPLALLFFLWSFMLRRAAGGAGGSGIFSFGKSWDPLESTCRHASLSIL